MMMPNGFSCKLDKCTNSMLTLFLFRNVKNLTILKEKLMAGELNCGVVKANLICSPFQITIAANKAMISKSNNAMTTKSIYTEMLYNLSLSKNITESLLKFGIDDKESNILIAFIDHIESPTNFETVLSIVDGEQIPINNLNNLYDENLIRKIYKIPDQEREISSLINSVVSRISIKGFA